MDKALVHFHLPSEEEVFSARNVTDLMVPFLVGMLHLL